MSVSKDEVFAVVRKHLLDICPDIDAAAIAPGVSMKDLGASSLDMVEVVSCAMRELAVRISRQDLSDIKDIGGLVDRLHDAAMTKAG
ncbi:MAG: acyl carrier protein [Alphaproteobacteria bacterium]|nr:acyl carrier protein [Alphaproteobacteria bacterium]